MDNLTVAMTREYTELIEIIRLLPEDERAMFPKNEIDFYERHKDKSYKFKIDPTIDLSKQNISQGAYALFLILYKKYIATPEENKRIDNILISNEKRKVELEKAMDNQQEKEDFPKTNAVIAYKNKESIFAKFMKKFKAIFGLVEGD
jgi:hypothetical protein